MVGSADCSLVLKGCCFTCTRQDEMRVWALVCVAVGVCGCVRAQGNQGSSTDTRIGLVSDQLGVAPVPTGPGGNIVGPRPIQGCFCLPVNQRCPQSIDGFTSIRIANRPTADGCPGQKLCCPAGSRPPVGPNPPTPPTGRDPPVIPQPVALGGCGVQNPIPYRQARFPEATFGEYPWTALVLGTNNDYLGGGVLIYSQWVLTAAHKVHQFRPFNVKVRLGDHDVGKVQDHPQFPHLEVGVSEIIIHPNFDPSNLQNDVALLRLAQPINTNNYPHIGLVCLPEQNQIFSGDNQCWVTGWGVDAFEGGQFQQILKEVDVPMVDHFRCQEKLRSTRLTHTFNLDRNSFVCAGGVIGKDACTGDGGAPLVCRTNRGFTLVGLVAWGIGCGQDGIPGVYVNVPNYVNFIKSIVGRAQG